MELAELNIYPQRNFMHVNDCFAFLYHELLKQGLVDTAYFDKLIDREKRYPTALEMGSLNIAIPHVDFISKKESKISLVTLKTPLSMYKMENPSQEIPVHIIILTLAKNNDEHLQMLEQLMSVFRNRSLLSKIYYANNTSEILNLLNTRSE